MKSRPWSSVPSNIVRNYPFLFYAVLSIIYQSFYLFLVKDLCLSLVKALGGSQFFRQNLCIHTGLFSRWIPSLPKYVHSPNQWKSRSDCDKTWSSPFTLRYRVRPVPHGACGWTCAPFFLQGWGDGPPTETLGRTLTAASPQEEASLLGQVVGGIWGSPLPCTSVWWGGVHPHSQGQGGHRTNTRVQENYSPYL